MIICFFWFLSFFKMKVLYDCCCSFFFFVVLKVFLFNIFIFLILIKFISFIDLKFSLNNRIYCKSKVLSGKF